MFFVRARMSSTTRSSTTRSIVSSAEFKAVLSEAASKSATVIVDFTASWCGPCQRTAPAYAALAEEFKHVIFLKVDVDEAQELAQEQGISAMPTFLAFVNKEQVATVCGANVDGLRAMVKQHAPAPLAPTHLFVALHSYMGTSRHVAAIAASIRTTISDALVITPKCYSLLTTLDGIEVCARRVLNELRGVVTAHPSLRYISLIGYSMGGTIARYLAGALHLESFLGLVPINYVSIATPHLGVDKSGGGFRRFITRTIGGRTGAQMTSADRSSLLAHMACRRSVFSQGLAAFGRRATYANAFGDRTVPFWSSYIAPWRHDTNTPMEPPPRLGPSPPRDTASYPHIEAEAAGAEVEAAAEPAGESSPAQLNEAVEPAQVVLTRVGRAPADPHGMSYAQLLAVCLALPLLLAAVVLPFWALLVPFATSLYAGKAVMRREPSPLEPALLALAPPPAPPPTTKPAREPGASNGAGAEAAPGVGAEAAAGCPEWSGQVLAEVVASSGAGSVQEWMARELNSLAWHKVSVRFSYNRDGLKALHTHGHIINRTPLLNRVGQDVVRHLVEDLRHPARM